jgi:hypothetical protein
MPKGAATGSTGCRVIWYAVNLGNELSFYTEVKVYKQFNAKSNLIKHDYVSRDVINLRRLWKELVSF